MSLLFGMNRSRVLQSVKRRHVLLHLCLFFLLPGTVTPSFSVTHHFQETNETTMTYFIILADQGILDALLKGVILNPGQFCTPVGVIRHTFDCHKLGSRDWKTEVILNILQCTLPPPSMKNYPAPNIRPQVVSKMRMSHLKNLKKI